MLVGATPPVLQVRTRCVQIPVLGVAGAFPLSLSDSQWLSPMGWKWTRGFCEVTHSAGVGAGCAPPRLLFFTTEGTRDSGGGPRSGAVLTWGAGAMWSMCSCCSDLPRRALLASQVRELHRPPRHILGFSQWCLVPKELLVVFRGGSELRSDL